MEVSSDFDGVDFDWFAIDKEGNLALFVTAGGGFVPGPVASASDAISSLTGQIPTPHIGTGLVWGDYGAVGLFVYDWAWPDGPYGLAQRPTRPMSSELRQAISSLPALPAFNVQFGVNEWVDTADALAT